MDSIGAAEETRKRLAAAGVMIERLLHDLKQPLNLIRFVAQDVALDIRKDRLEIELLPESMDQIKQSVDQLVGQIDQLRCFAKPGDTVSKGPGTDPGVACRKALVRIRTAHPDVELADTISEKLPVLRIDAAGLEQAVFELLTNAARAAAGGEGPGAPRVQLFALVRDKQVVIGVEDNGRGVPEEARARLLDPFFSTRKGAAGLGLSLALALVVEAGGRVTLAETGEDGSRFEILLPEQMPE